MAVVSAFCSKATNHTRIGKKPNGSFTLMALLGLVYSGRQCQRCHAANDIALIKLFRFLNKASESLEKWVATPIDQI